MRIVTAEEMKKIDDTAVDEVGIPSLILMENAGIEAARKISEICEEKKYDGEILIFCGKGKNGGDGLVVARRLIANGHRVRIFLLHSSSEFKNEAAVHLRVLEQQRAKIFSVESASIVAEYFNSATPPFMVVDALLGTGLKRPIEGLYYDVVEVLNKYSDELIALDIPTGVNGDSGKTTGNSVIATHTISFGFPKLGHFLPPGAARRGKLYNVDLCFPKQWSKEGDKFLLTHDNIAPLLQTRDRYGHKNSFGHSLLIGGSPGRTGAIALASQSCLRMGTGLATVASWEESFPSVETRLPAEIMTFRIRKEAGDFPVPAPGISQFSSVVIGPGLGLGSDAGELLKRLVQEYRGPLVIDADGLNLIAEHKLHEFLAKRGQPVVLTPHPGEMARLLDISKDAVVEDPVKCVRQAVEKTGAVVLLKGATTLIHSAEGVTWFNHYPNDGMATAGSGDVLAGMIGGLLGQKMNPVDATRLGVYLHSLAGRKAAAVYGHRAMTASAIVEKISESFKELRTYVSSAHIPSCVELV
ncbi:MAG: NAD(P)H-hydrate dehydratase [Bacteriovoracia bacterium]